MTGDPERTTTLTLAARLRASVDVVYREMVKFGAVGGIAFVVDTGLFNLLLHGLGPAEGPLDGKPLTAKTMSVVVATIVAWLGNRYWTFRHRRRASRRREFVLFFGMNAAGLGIALACLGLSRYVLGLTSPLADNIAANVIGLGLGTLFRFWAYKRFVFTETEELVAELTQLADLTTAEGARTVLDVRRAERAAELAAALPATSPEHAELAAERLAEDVSLAEELLRMDGATSGSAKRREP